MKQAPEIGVKGARENVKQPTKPLVTIVVLKRRYHMNNDVADYTQDTDYHAIMMYDPLYERLDRLGHELVMTKIDLSYAESQAKFWKQMYENEVEFNNRQR